MAKIDIKVEWVLIDDVKENKNNPRKFTESSVEKMVNSIKEDPEMLEIRPLVIDSKGVVMGGNLRLKSLKILKYKEVPVLRIPKGWSKDKIKRFIVKDNIELGQWDFEMLMDDYEMKDLIGWGLEGDALSKSDEIDSTEEFEEAKKVFEIDPPEYPKLKERIQISIPTIRDYEKIKKAVEDHPDFIGALKKMLKV